LQFHPFVRSLKPFGFSDYTIHAQRTRFAWYPTAARVPEETDFFKMPAGSVRTSTGAPESRIRGTLSSAAFRPNSVTGGGFGRVDVRNGDIGAVIRISRTEMSAQSYKNH
jgi:UDP-N-acetylglucosamine 2-epimerase (non-hydrolysing)